MGAVGVTAPCFRPISDSYIANIMIGPINHSPQQLREVLLQQPSPVFLDTETSGLLRYNRVLSIGVRVQGVNYILFTDACCHASIIPYVSSTEAIRSALKPLLCLSLVFHNAKFDLPRLRQFGVAYAGRVIDTLQLLRLLDQDRGFHTESQGRQRPRIDLNAPGGPRYLNYRLKDVASQLCGIKPFYTPDTTMSLVPFETHRRYLAHDLFAPNGFTSICGEAPHPLKQWWRSVGSPLTYELCKLTDLGIAADGPFIRNEVERISGVMEAVSAEHQAKHGVALVGLGDWSLRQLLYIRYGLPKRWRKGAWPIDDETLGDLVESSPSTDICNSLKLIRGFRQLASLRTRLAAYAKTIDSKTGRIHSSFDNRQSTGRISSSKPNLQQLAAKRSSWMAHRLGRQSQHAICSWRRRVTS